MLAEPNDTYDVLNLIGRGAFGEIRRVRRHRDNLILCRKEILWKRMTTREQEQLATEIRILRDLQHKNIVRYVSEMIDRETKMVYIYMEYCGNGDLWELIQKRKDTSPVVRFSEHTVWQIFVQLALALFRCHNGVDPPPLEDISNPTTQGMAQTPQPRPGCIVLHRDIKPQNVFLDHNNRVKLGDFGLSKELRGQNLAETYVGTPFYMSPEIINGRAYNAKSDIWALGCVIYEMCAFDPPFQARDQLDLNRKIKNGMVGSITRFGYTDSLNAVVQSCLRQDEKSRPSAAGLLRKSEMIMARQQLGYVDREEVLLQREASVIAREKEIEYAINSKVIEIREREEALTRREEQLRQAESNQVFSLQDSVQRRLLEAERNLQIMAGDKLRLEQQVADCQAQLINASRPQLHHVPHSDMGVGSHGGVLSEAMSYLDGPARAARPNIGRAQSEMPYRPATDNDDPLHLKPLPSSPVRPDSGHRKPRSPQRRKSQVPMSRIRPEATARPVLTDNPAAIQGLTRAMSKQDLRGSGTENIRPSSAMEFEASSTLMGARTPTKKSTLGTPGSNSKPAWPTPTRGKARTLFADEPHRKAPSAPYRADRLGVLQKAGMTRKVRQCAAMYSQDDEPSPFKKATVYGSRD